MLYKYIRDRRGQIRIVVELSISKSRLCRGVLMVLDTTLCDKVVRSVVLSGFHQ